MPDTAQLRFAFAQARTEAFLGANGFLYPGRFDAHGESLGVRQFQGNAILGGRVAQFPEHDESRQAGAHLFVPGHRSLQRRK